MVSLGRLMGSPGEAISLQAFQACLQASQRLTSGGLCWLRHIGQEVHLGPAHTPLIPSPKAKGSTHPLKNGEKKSWVPRAEEPPRRSRGMRDMVHGTEVICVWAGGLRRLPVRVCAGY